MSNSPATAKAFTDWKSFAQSDQIDPSVCNVIKDAVRHGDVGVADSHPQPTPVVDQTPANRRSNKP